MMWHDPMSSGASRGDESISGASTAGWQMSGRCTTILAESRGFWRGSEWGTREPARIRPRLQRRSGALYAAPARMRGERLACTAYRSTSGKTAKS